MVRPLLPVPGWLRGRGGQPEAYCHRAMLDAIRYLVDNGTKWRAMPADFPPWDRVYAFFRRWRNHDLVREFHDRLRRLVRERAGRDSEPGAGVIDSQSVKADAVVGSDSRGFDGGKLINGRKRHVVVDTLGLLLAVMVTAADVSDRAAAQVLLTQATAAHHLLALVWADGGYTGSLVEYCLAALALVLALVLAIVKRSDDMHGFVVLPKRWIVERFFAHLMRSRRLVRDLERSIASAEAMVYWSMTMLMTRRVARHVLRERESARCRLDQPAARPQPRGLRSQCLHLSRYGVQAEAGGHLLARQRSLTESVTVAEGLQDALVVHRQRRPGQPRAPHRHHCFRLRRLRRFGPRRLHTGSRQTLGGSGADDGVVARGQYLANA